MQKVLLLVGVVVAAAFGGHVAFAMPPEEDKVARIAFVNEFIRELGVINDVRERWEKDHRADTSTAQEMATAIRTSTRAKLELATNINMLGDIHLNSRFNDFRVNLQDIYKQKMVLQDEITKIASEFISGPKPGVDYGALAARMPQITATNDYLDKILFDASPAVFLSLVDEKEDREGHLSHLIITAAQRKQMVNRIESLFGSTKSDKDKNYITSIAWLIRDALLKNYKLSDDPW